MSCMTGSMFTTSTACPFRTMVTERLKHAIPRFDQRHRKSNGFPASTPSSDTMAFFNPPSASHDKVMQQSPALAIGDPAAIGRVGKGDEIEPFRLRHRSIERDRAFDRTPMLNIDDVIGVPASEREQHSRRQEQHCKLTMQRSTSRAICLPFYMHSLMAFAVPGSDGCRWIFPVTPARNVDSPQFHGRCDALWATRTKNRP